MASSNAEWVSTCGGMPVGGNEELKIVKFQQIISRHTSIYLSIWFTPLDSFPTIGKKSCKCLIYKSLELNWYMDFTINQLVIVAGKFLRRVQTLCMALRAARNSPVYSNGVINYAITAYFKQCCVIVSKTFPGKICSCVLMFSIVCSTWLNNSLLLIFMNSLVLYRTIKTLL